MTDAILNLGLSTVLPGLMAVLGVVMSFRQSNETRISRKERWLWIGGFVVLFTVSIPLAAWKEKRSTDQQEGAIKRADEAENRRISDTQYMNGKLDAISIVLANISTRPSDFSGLARSLANFAKETPQEAAARRRSAAQAKLGELVGEGKNLLERCEGLREISDEFSNSVSDWLRSSRAAIGGSVDPTRLMGIDYSPEPHRQDPTVYCRVLDNLVRGVEDVLNAEFAPR